MAIQIAWFAVRYHIKIGHVPHLDHKFVRSVQNNINYVGGHSKSMLTDHQFILLIGINLISFALFGIDKRRAIEGEWRISERNLLLGALVAPFGAFLGMRAFRHKVRKAKFAVTIPLLVAFHILLYSWGMGLIDLPL